jgi:hypothetical protein
MCSLTASAGVNLLGWAQPASQFPETLRFYY